MATTKENIPTDLSITDVPEAAVTDSARAAKIAERAYCIAESRGFEPGHELDDWFEAEQACDLEDQ